MSKEAIIASVISFVATIIGATIGAVVSWKIAQKNIDIAKQANELEIIKLKKEKQDLIQKYGNYTNDSFAQAWKKDTEFRIHILHEYSYLGSICHPNRTYKTIDDFPLIENNIERIVGDAETSADEMTRIGALRSNIDIYATLLHNKADVSTLKIALADIYKYLNELIGDSWESYMKSINALRAYNEKLAQEIATTPAI